MIPLDLSGKLALVTGVGDNVGFAWYIAKALQAAGARLVFACHPRLLGIVENILERDADADTRVLPFGAGNLNRNDRRYQKHGDFSIQGMITALGKDFGAIDVLIHSIAFSPEITKKAAETSRQAYLTALSISSYSLTALLRAAQPLMENRPDGTAALGLTYLGGDRVVPHYGGGMSTAKAALQMDAKQLASNLGPKKIRVNLISAGPYASRAARAIGDIDKMIQYAAERAPLQRGIEPEEVANAAVFLCSPLASAITGEVLYVDCGYNVMGV